MIDGRKTFNRIVRAKNGRRKPSRSHLIGSVIEKAWKKALQNSKIVDAFKERDLAYAISLALENYSINDIEKEEIEKYLYSKNTIKIYRDKYLYFRSTQGLRRAINTNDLSCFIEDFKRSPPGTCCPFVGAVCSMHNVPTNKNGQKTSIEACDFILENMHKDCSRREIIGNMKLSLLIKMGMLETIDTEMYSYNNKNEQIRVVDNEIYENYPGILNQIEIGYWEVYTNTVTKLYLEALNFYNSSTLTENVINIPGIPLLKLYGTYSSLGELIDHIVSQLCLADRHHFVKMIAADLLRVASERVSTDQREIYHDVEHVASSASPSSGRRS